MSAPVIDLTTERHIRRIADQIAPACVDRRTALYAAQIYVYSEMLAGRGPEHSWAEFDAHGPVIEHDPHPPSDCPFDGAA